MDQAVIGRCSFLDVLEEAVVLRRRVGVELSGGETFIDEISDVVTEAGQEWAVFKRWGRVNVGAIRAVTRQRPGA